MKEKHTYKHVCRGQCMFILVSVMVLMLTTIMPHMGVVVDAASILKLRYNQKNYQYTGPRLSVTLDGKSVKLDGTPGVALKNAKKETIYMVPAKDVYQKGCGATFRYKNRTLTLSQYGTTIKMKLNSKTAYVNGKKKTMDYPLKMIKFRSVNKTKLYVPSMFVSKNLGYQYSYQRTSSTKVTVKLKSEDFIKYDGTWKKYTKTKADLFFDGEKVDVSDMPCIVMQERFYVQAKAFAKKVIGGKYGYDSANKCITLNYGDKLLVMYAGSRTAYLNGKTVKLDAAPRLVYSSKRKKTYVMVPISRVASLLEWNYRYENKKCVLSRRDGVYFNWSVPAVDVASLETVTDENEEGIIDDVLPPVASYDVLSVQGERICNQDIVSVDGNFLTSQVIVSEEGSLITVTIEGAENKVGKESVTLKNPYLLKSVTLSEDVLGNAVIEIRKKNADIHFKKSMEDGFLSITLMSEPISIENGYKIAVDVGHGAYTAGKRTPKLLESLDFDKDGIIDAAKGTQIREHTANVGVGNYAVAALERCGFEVYKSGFGTADTPLTTRQNNIRASKSDYSISIHFNAAGSGASFNSASGIETFYHQRSANAKNSQSLAKAIQNKVAGGTSQKNRGLNNQHTFAMCNASAMGTKGSILLECAFMTNWHEVKTMMANTNYWEETGEEIAKGFCSYLGVKYIEP